MKYLVAYDSLHLTCVFIFYIVLMTTLQNGAKSFHCYRREN